MNNPLISFIIPVFNVTHTLIRKCVQTIVDLNLTHDEREIIIIDDGSETPMESCMKDFNGLVHVFRQKNQGLSMARNAGMEMAKGQYIQFVDADDHLITSIYNQCLAILKEQKPDILKFHYTHDENTQYKPFQTRNYLSGAEYMTSNNMEAGACAYIFKRSILRKLTFKPGILHEDEDFTPILFLKAGKFLLADTTPYFYFKRQNSIVTSFSESSIEKRMHDFYDIILSQNQLLSNIIHALGENKLSDEQYNSLLESFDSRLKDVEISNKSVEALRRRIDQASMDYIINVIRLHKRQNGKHKLITNFFFVWKKLSAAIKQMKADSLFPLRNKCSYTKNYRRFCIIVNNPLLRPLIMLIK